jgi:DNA-binding transcriptional regulator LsrR (DeoR family)
MVRIARLYYEQGVRQTQIASRLHISQTRVSRLLKQAGQVGIVRTIVTTPPTLHPELEEALEKKFDLLEAIVVDCPDEDPTLYSAIGQTLASFLSSTLSGGEDVGISSWSATVLSAIDRLSIQHPGVVKTVVQIVGGLGKASSQTLANRAFTRFADITGATPLFLPAPGLVESPRARDAFMVEPSVTAISQRWEHLDACIMGIGSIDQSPLLKESGNALQDTDIGNLRDSGAVGDVCLRFFDKDGKLSPKVDDRIIGIPAETLLNVPRRIGAAGGTRKRAAILGALRGRWINILVTDTDTAKALLEA